MFKRVTAILLIGTMLCANFSRLFVYAGFELNKNYIAAKLCENRDKQWLHCNGKCFLMKKIKQVEEKEKSDEQQSQKNLFQDAFYTPATIIKFHTQILQVIAIPNNNFKLPQVNSTIFRPPQLG